MTPAITLKIVDSPNDPDKYTIQLLIDGAPQPFENEIPKSDFNIEPDPRATMLNNTGISPDFQKIGKKLYDLVHGGKVGAEWDKFKGENEKFRLYLEIEPAEIVTLPWELINDGNRRLAATPKQRLIRRYKPTTKIEKIENGLLPLRILIVAGDMSDPAIQAPEEIRQIKFHIRNNLNFVHRIIDLEVLARPTLDRLERVYKAFRPDIFHFIGHGGFDFYGNAMLVLNAITDAGTPTLVQWTSDVILHAFESWDPDWLPRFVFINACRSNVALTNERMLDQSWSIGKVFRELNIPAVLTMQADIKGTVAGIFAGALYKSLAELKPLDEALIDARGAVWRRVQGELQTRDWATPVLTLGVSPDEVFSLKPPVPPNILQNIVRCKEFNEIDYFAARVVERREMIRSFYPLPPDSADRNLIIIKGKKDTGKSWLAKFCLQVCALLNHEVRYVEVGGPTTKTSIDILLHIVRGDPIMAASSLIYHPLDRAPFEDFFWNLKRRIQKKEPSERGEQTVEVKMVNGAYQLDDEVLGLPAEAAPTLFKETFKSFVEALKQTASPERPLIIVLDNFAGIREQEITEHLIPLLIQPVANGDLINQAAGETSSRVKFIMVVDNDEFDKFHLNETFGNIPKIVLDPFNQSNFYPYLEEFLYYAQPTLPTDKVEDLSKMLKETVYLNKQEFLPGDVWAFATRQG